MNYCTVDEMITMFGENELIVRSARPEPGSIPKRELDRALVQTSINDAEAEINMYLEGRNLLPLKTVPEVLRRLTADIARYYLYNNPNEDNPVNKRYHQRVKQLEGIAAGRLALGLDNSGEVQTPEDVVMFNPGRNMFRNDSNGGGIW
ncbi:MAG: gp436 family protein [Pseudomonadota bacterium]